MTYFKPLDEPEQMAVIVENGVYRQVPLYSRNGQIFAKVGSGFIRLSGDGSTSKPRCRIEALICDVELRQDRLGRLCDASVSGAKALPQDRAQLLLGAPE